MFKIIYKLFDSAHGIYAYTVEKEETGVWADVAPSMIKSEIDKISNATLDTNSNIVAENIEKVYTGTDHTNPNTKGGKIISGYNDLFTWCKKNRRFDIIEAYDLAVKAGVENLPIKQIPFRSYQKKINLVCPTCKHQFEASPVFLTQRKNLCPACSARKGSSRTVVSGANDLETWCKANNRLDLLAEYSPDNPKPANQIAYTSHDKVKWVCQNTLPNGQKCGYTWHTYVSHRTSKTHTSNCSACSARIGKGTRLVTGINDFETWCKANNHEDVLKAWSPNNTIKPSEIAQKSYDRKVYLVCSVCGGEIVTTPHHIIQSRTPTTCVNCRASGTSTPQIMLYEIIKRNFNDALYRNKISGIEADIFIPSLKLVIEYNGHYHLTEHGKELDESKIATFNSFGLNVLTVQEHPTKDVEIHVDKNDSNKINIWYKYNTDPKTYEFILQWINNMYNKQASFTRQDLEESSKKAIDTMSRKNVINSLAETHPEIAAQWDYERNGNLRPEMFTHGSHQEVYWKCTKCNKVHSYKMMIKKRCIGRGCPYIAGKKVMPGLNDVASAVPNLIGYCWNFPINVANSLDPTLIAKGNSKLEASFICPHCGHVWISKLYAIIGKHLLNNTCPSCPSCKRKLPFR